MYPAPIEEYVAPTTIEGALAQRRALGDGAVFIAGGMSLMQAVKARLIQPQALIDLGRIESLRGITAGDSSLTIGAMTRYADIGRSRVLFGGYGALADAASTVGDRQVRNCGTIGGSLCWNYLASCMPTAALCLDARLELAASNGTRRTIRIDEFLISPLETVRRDDELLVTIHLANPPPRSGSAYQKFGGNVDGLPIVGVAAYIALDAGGSCIDARFAVGGVLPRAQRFMGIKDRLVGKEPAEALLAEAADAAADVIETHDDHWASADYRRTLIRSIGRAVLALTAARATGVP
jgi:carbon-monoxide dehydrogenase medium subunit